MQGVSLILLLKMSPEDMKISGLPASFSSTKVSKRTSKNRKKKAQKKSKQVQGKSRKSGEIETNEFNYAEEFVVEMVLKEYKKEFTVLMSKSDQFKNDDEHKEEEYEYEELAHQFKEDGDELIEEEHESVELDYEYENDTESSPPILIELPEEKIKASLQKYYHQRYDYFSLYDSGIKIDEEGWYSVTPEIIANHIALEAHKIALTNNPESGFTCIVDAFCGVGGNTIQFAKYFDKVIAIDLDSGRLEMARHNATIYGVVDKIQFILGDVFEVLNILKKEINPDLVFMSPPWGGPTYINQSIFCPRDHLLDSRGQELFDLGRNLSKNLILFLPRQSNIFTFAQFLRDEKGKVCKEDESFVVEQHWLKNRLKALSVYFY